MSGFGSYSDKRTGPLRVALPLRGTWALLVAVLFGCATREVPVHYPAESAASPEAKAQAPWVVTRSLSADPPLPGERAEGWEALEAQPSTGSGQPGAGHGHPHHGQPHHEQPHHGQPHHGQPHHEQPHPHPHQGH